MQKKKKISYFAWPCLLSFCLLIGMLLSSCGSSSSNPNAGSTTDSIGNVSEELNSQGLADGSYEVNVTLEGGSGKATIESPATLSVQGEVMKLTLVWSSKNYDYMLVDGTKYLNEAAQGDYSTFTIPVKELGVPFTVIGDTIAMSTPHEVEYELTVTLSGNPGQSFSDSIDSSANGQKGAGNKDSDAGYEDFGKACGLTKTGEMELQYADQFSIEYYGEYQLLTIVNDGRYLLVPEDTAVPQGIPSDVTVLQLPLENVYLVSTSAIDLVREVGGLTSLRFLGVNKEDLYIEEAVKLLESGDLLYAGKYSAPDYELILSNGCSLAIENTMVLHKPDVVEKLKELGIPVLIEHSSYETHPLGRLEWMKVYGALLGKEATANQYFEGQMKELSSILKAGTDQTEKGPTVAYFSLNTAGSVTVRKPGDYIAKMIELSGGAYALSKALAGEENAMSTMNMQFEDFYVSAKDADILIYNSAIEGEIKSVQDLVQKNALFAEFKAVKSGNVYCTSKNFFQESTGIGTFIEDMYAICKNDSAHDFTYIRRLD